MGGDESPPSSEPHGDQADAPVLEPMTVSLLGRFFAVPLLIIGGIVGGAVLVVLLFGGPAASPERSVAELLQVLEANSGKKSLGVLLPREKELWQTALDLSVTLKHKSTRLSEEDLEVIAERLGNMVRVDMVNLDRIPTVDEERANQRRVRSKRLEFLIHALGRTERPRVIDDLVEIVRIGHEPYARVAMQELGNLRALPEARRAIAPMVALLTASTTPETRLVACTALSVLASPDDQAVIDALAATRLVEDGEVAWSAALALARLGSSAGASTLVDLLDRRFLGAPDRLQIIDENGRVHRYRLEPDRVDEILLAAIDSASNLLDAVLWEQINELKSDPSPPVRMRAIEALASRQSAGVAEPLSKD